MSSNLSSKNLSIHKTAKEKAKKYLISEADLLSAIMEVDKYKVFAQMGYTHLTPYCVHELKLSEEVAANFVRVARKSIHVPELKTAIDQGELTLNKAKAISSIINADNKDTWIQKAKDLSHKKLEKEIVETNPKASQREKSKDLGQNRIRVEFELSEEELVLLRRAQDLICQRRKKAATMAETYIEVVKEYLEKNDPLLKVKKVSQAKQKTQDPSREGFIPRAIKQAVLLRDEARCQAKTPQNTPCGQGRWIHLHHIKPVSQGGSSTVENLITLCSAHHRWLHKYGPGGQ